MALEDTPSPLSSRRSGCEGRAFLHLLGDHREAGQRMRTECRDHRNIRGVAAPSYQNSADPRLIVSRVERKPATAKKGFEPSVEIHRRRIRQNPDVAEVAVAVACRDVEAST